MSAIFLKIVNMSLTASWLILAVIILRFLFTKAPKWINCLLWGIVALRLVMPFSFESVFSLIPDAEPIPLNIAASQTPMAGIGAPAINNALDPIITESFAPESGTGIQMILLAASVIWVIGMAVMLTYSIVSCIILHGKVRASLLYRNNTYYCDHIDTPFILGIIKPAIYIPSGIADAQIDYVIQHENAHLKRHDHWWKPIGFALMTVYWFNPVIWIAYILFCRDIEKACDEKVIKDMDNIAKKSYSEALVSCSIKRRTIFVCPLAFGEIGVKDRIKSVLNYKRPTLGIIIIAVMTCVSVAVCFLTDPFDLTLDNILNEKGYTIEKQKLCNLTLSIPVDSLPDSIYSNEGLNFSKDDIIAYQNDTSVIYLEKVQFANEGDDQLFFIFNCSYDLPESGSILFPYEVADNEVAGKSYSTGIYIKSETLTDDAGSYDDAINFRGIGSGEQFAFYVSTDVCKNAVGSIKIEILCNELTYYKGTGDNTDTSLISEPLENTVPDLTVSCGTTAQTAWRGTYSWTQDMGNGMSRIVIADSSHPTAFLDYFEQHYISVTDSNSSPPVAILIFDIDPSEISVNCWKNENGNYEKTTVEVDGFNVLLKTDGTYLYEVLAQWTDPEENVRGTVDYGFCTK